MEQNDYRKAGNIIVSQISEGTQEAAAPHIDDSFMGSEFPSFAVKRLEWEQALVSGTVLLVSLDPACAIRLVAVGFYVDFISETIDFILLPPTDLM